MPAKIGVTQKGNNSKEMYIVTAMKRIPNVPIAAFVSVTNMSERVVSPAKNPAGNPIISNKKIAIKGMIKK